MSDPYTDQPPPSSGTLQPPPGDVNTPTDLPPTGSDVGVIVGLGLIVACTGAFAVAAVRRHRNPWRQAERERQDRRRDWDRLK